MRILAVSDLHGDAKPLITYLKDNRVDLIIIAGDITHFGQGELALVLLNELSTLQIPVLAIPGYFDPVSVYVNIDNSQAINLHARNMVVKNIGLCGFGGSNPTPFNTPLEFEEIQIYDEAKKHLKVLKTKNNFSSLAPPIWY